MFENTSIELSIFEPLKKYFELISVFCPTFQNCDDKCFENYKKMLASNNCDINDGLSENFMNNLKKFAHNINKADCVMGNKTLKNTFVEIFNNSFTKNSINLNDSLNLDAIKKNKKNIINDIINSINANETVQKTGFKISDKVDVDSKTYEELLEVAYSNLITKFENFKNKNSTNKNLNFVNDYINLWLLESFEYLYENCEKYFRRTFLNDLKDCKSKKLQRCQKNLMEKFFEIKNEMGEIVGWNEFWGNAEPENWGLVKNLCGDENSYENKNKCDYRLNAKNDGKFALISYLFPKEVHTMFNDLLINPQNENDLLIGGDDKDLDLKLDQDTILNFVKKEISNLLITNKNEKYNPDGSDDEKYVDNNSNEYKFRDDFQNEINEYTNKWAADKTGDLYYKNDDGKYVEYNKDKEKMNNDLESIGDMDKCGNLNIFDDVNKCNEFFKKILDNNSKPYNVDELSKVINSDNFVPNYYNLKKNLVNVNPLFIIKTLKIFGFQKYEELNDDGTKIIKIEPFSRWWNRHKSSISKDSRGKSFPGRHPKSDMDMENPPANLKLFFKLLIEFINNNEFVLNPVDKKIFSKNKKLTTGLARPMENFSINGKLIPNSFYKQEMAMYNNDVYNDEKLPSYSDLLKMMNKNPLINKGIKFRSKNDLFDLNTMLSLIADITTGRKNNFLKNIPPYTTGHNIIGGTGTDVEDYIKTNNLGDLNNAFQCSKQLIDLFLNGEKNLKKKNKNLDENTRNQILNNIKDMTDLEKDLYNRLYKLTKYIEIIKILNDDTDNQNLNFDIIEKDIKKFEKKSSEFSNKIDVSVLEILKNLFDNKSSYYADL